MKIYIETEETDNMLIKSQEQDLERQQKRLDDKERNLKKAKLTKQLTKLNQE